MRYMSILTLSALLLQPITTYAASADRPSLMAESFYVQRQDQQYYDPRLHSLRSTKSNESMMWHKILLELGIKNAPPEDTYRYTNRNYGSALSILQDIRRELGESNDYQKIWAENQNRVYQDKKPVLDTSKKLPARAISDFKYQMGSFYFYDRDEEEALKYYRQVENMRGAPVRPLAAYMVARTLARQGKKEEAYNKAVEILKDETLKSVHDIARNYRFIVTYYSRRDDKFTNELAKVHLQWLLDIIQVDPIQSSDLNQAFTNYFDAFEHLDKYFPRYDPDDKSVDWWLQNIEAKSPRMKAVIDFTPENEMIDWMQASWAYNVFQDDWLWALHGEDNEYWDQNANIVEHAWGRWKNGDGLEWLEIAIQRVNPDSNFADQINKAAQAFLVNKPDENESREYKTWFHNIWSHSIRLYLGQKKYEAAYALFQDASYGELLEDNKYWYRRRPDSHQQELAKAIRWLVYTGEVDEARKFLSAAQEQYPKSYGHWQTLLATDWQQAFNANVIDSYHYKNVDDHATLWRKMLNVISTKEQYKIAASDKIDPEEKRLLSWSVLTRGMLLNNRENLDDYAAFAANQNLSARAQILEAVENNSKDDYIHFMLRTPRVRAVPFTLSFISKEESPVEIDIYNHSDNNWWCAYNSGDLYNEIVRAASIRPQGRFPKIDVVSDTNPYLENIEKILTNHPYQDLIDAKETKALEAIPSGPEYLSEAVIQDEQKKRWMFWRREESKNQSAANLHYAVRTTRYGCERNGSHGQYSHAAFKILHDVYPKTIWAKVTPYWFSDKHF